MKNTGVSPLAKRIRIRRAGRDTSIFHFPLFILPEKNTLLHCMKQSVGYFDYPFIGRPKPASHGKRRRGFVGMFFAGRGVARREYFVYCQGQKRRRAENRTQIPSVVCLGRGQTKAHRQGVVHGAHGALVQVAHPLPQAGFVQGADLLQQDDAVPVQAHAGPRQVDVGGQAGLSLPTTGLRSAKKISPRFTMFFHAPENQSPVPFYVPGLFIVSHERKEIIPKGEERFRIAPLV